MALIINELCTCCDACLHVCPNDAIRANGANGIDSAYYLIEADLCTECVGEYADAQCAAICPIEGAIVDELGVALNPPGSLTGIPPHKLAPLQLVEAHT
jgi:ferredoxin